MIKFTCLRILSAQTQGIVQKWAVLLLFITFIQPAFSKDVLLQTERENVSLSVYQQVTITGTVSDSTTGETLPGVNILIKGTQQGTVADADGKFAVQVPENAVLVFSYIGYATQEIAVAGRSVINVMMKSDIQALEEVVVVGYGVQRRSDVTGSTARLTSENMNVSVATNPTEMIQGRVSGVNVLNNDGEPGSGMSVRIRGSNSIRSGQEPLYVVDGVPLDNADLTPEGITSAGFTGSSNKNPLTFLNPEDIESIDILKDASSTAIYGARGANGVVLITTKKGKTGEGSLSYDGYVGIANIANKIKVLSAEDFRAYRRPDNTSLQDEGSSTDWQDEIYRTALTHSHTITYGGGTDKHTYRASIGYLNQEGIVKTSEFDKINGKIQVTQNAFKDRLLLTGNVIISHIKDRRIPLAERGGFEGDVILNSLKLNPTFPVYNEDGSYNQFSTTQRNPVAMLRLTDDVTITDHYIANVSGELEIIKNLKYKINIGYDRTVAERRINQDNELTYLANHGEADINDIQANNKLIENYITYNRDFGENHSFTFLLGQAYQYFRVATSRMNVKGFEVEDIQYTSNLGYGDIGNATISSTDAENELQSFFGRINYNFREKYLFTFTGRFDGSSRFGENNKYGFFPSGAIAWRISEEEFMSGKLFSNLKIRVGYGVTGNQEIPNKISQLAVGTVNTANWFVNNNVSPGITYVRTPNPDIKWESTEQFDVGIDFGFLGDRLSGTIDYFHKNTKDVLLEITAKSPTPVANQWLNVPDLRIVNDGIEVGLNGVLVKTASVNWTAGLNFSYIKNNVKDLPVTLIQTGIASGQGISETRVQVITNDEPIGTFYGRRFLGFDENGISRFKTDENGNEVLEPLGSALPDYTYSFSSKVEFGKFDLSMFWYGVSGNEVYNNTANALFVKGSLNSGSNVTKEVLNSPESIANANAFSSRFVEDGSFLRLSNVTLGYNFTSKMLPFITSGRIYLTGNNLFVITDYSGFDPEVNTDANERGIPSIGIDYTTYPKARAFTLGLNLSF